MRRACKNVISEQSRTDDLAHITRITRQHRLYKMVDLGNMSVNRSYFNTDRNGLDRNIQLPISEMARLCTVLSLIDVV